MCFSPATQERPLRLPKTVSQSTRQGPVDFDDPVIPGLPDDVGKYCLALIPRCHLPVLGAVSKRWRAYVQSREFLTIRKEAGKLEEWLYVLTGDADGKGSHWEVLSSSSSRLGEGKMLLPPMPGPVKAGFGVVVLDGNLLVMAGHHSSDDGAKSVSSEAYQYDSRLNRWTALARMNVARFDFACAELNGAVYAVGGYGAGGESLSSAEVYEPAAGRWRLIESLRRPRWGPSPAASFTIGNSRSVDVYDSEKGAWGQIKQGCVMVTAHAALGGSCSAWSGRTSGGSRCSLRGQLVGVGARAGDRRRRRGGVPVRVLDGKLLLFSVEDAGYQTLVYDPAAAPGDEWRTSPLKALGDMPLHRHHQSLNAAVPPAPPPPKNISPSLYVGFSCVRLGCTLVFMGFLISLSRFGRRCWILFCSTWMYFTIYRYSDLSVCLSL
ncbi:unnamed protein product [Spirodela intermedia]|uniref:F-box domain-containing protein n=1 Tax=Spirodela intermedia TaxID=51605 RepID=A0A7I8JFR7_SPIIN|nr:unnamed protein product [Spirodela intermedia]CAA6668363.1 unnamed protein product [Spirodela intermedia]